MKTIKTLAFIILMATLNHLHAQNHISKIPSLNNEKWWGGMVGRAAQMPYKTNTAEQNLQTENANNQNVPLLLSSQGRYIWSEHPFSFHLQNDTIIIQSKYETISPIKAGNTLKEAHLVAAKKHFPATGTIPEEIFFTKPQYNTWIELMYNQNQEDILNYAHNILKHNFPTGIFMVDDNWQRYYGNFDFKAEKFPNPKAMTDTLHKMGFKIMLWICPFYSPDTPEYREMRNKGFLLKNKNNQPAIINWWNGYSACLDVTNPEAVAYFKEKLKQTQEKYGIDGFKFDAGDVSYMPDNIVYHDPKANANIFSQKWAEIALEFPYNELRTTWKTGGQPIVQRLGDKAYSWYSNQILIPGMTTAGILGFPYTCPDMIGGGEYQSFLNMENKKLDEELIIRSCQIHAMMPMMQFSVAPWRILSKENIEICAKYAKLHEKIAPYIIECAKKASKTNIPIIQSMEYAFPHQGFIDCNDQFMLGEKYMIAPMTKPGNKRTVKLPKGTWKDDTGKTYKGEKNISINVPIDRLPYFEKIK